MDLFGWLRHRGGGDERPGTRPSGVPDGGSPRPARPATPTSDRADGSASGDADPAVPRPVSADRIRDFCERHGYAYFTDSQGDVGGIWRGRLFFFFLLGEGEEVLQIRGHWNREFAIERLGEVLDLCNSWHVEKIWPVTYARVRDNGRVTVTAEVTTDVSCGATDDQLELMLQCGLGTSTVFFDAVDAAYPDPAGRAP